ncbi:hypothetical protein OH686_14910 [Pseudomonas sp. SO81]|nr:hypothetical protein OH686_14910 [Pseudomonas sp. SO81]
MIPLAQALGEDIECLQGLVDAVVERARRMCRRGSGEILGFELVTRVEEAEPIHNQFLTNHGRRDMRRHSRAVTGIGGLFLFGQRAAGW